MEHSKPLDLENQDAQSSQNHNSWDSLSEPLNFKDLIQLADETDINILSLLNSTNPEAKQEFLTHPELERPNNEWAKMDGPRCKRNLAVISATEARVGQANLSYPERLLLESQLAYNRKKNNLVLATYQYNHAETPDEKAAAAEAQAIANRELYGMPDEMTFYALLNQKLGKIFVPDLNPNQRRQYDELISMLGDIPDVDESYLYRPDPETVTNFGEMMRIFYEPFLRHIPDSQEVFTPQDAADIVNEVIHDEVGENTGWHAVVKPEATLASVGADKKVISFPGARSKGNYSRVELEKIIIHELGTHALRAMAVENTEFKAFRSESFEGRETFEEGIAKVMEQALEGRADDPDSPAPSRYIMIGLANIKKANFRQIFEIMKRLESLTGGWNEGQIYDNLQRTFRGTGVLPNNKDLAYYNGNVRAWQYVEDRIDNPEMLFEDIFLSGKINPEDPAQARLSYAHKTDELGR